MAPMKSPKRKAEVITNGGFSARITSDVTDGRRGWRVTWNAPDRRRRFFSDIAEAKEQARRIVAELRAGRPAVANADVSDLDELSRARRHLLNIDASIEQAVKEYAEAYRALGGRSVSGFIQAQLSRMGTLNDATIAEVAAEMIREKEARGKGRSWIKSLKNFLIGKVAPAFPHPILAITPDELNAFLSRWSGRTRNNYLTFLVTLFNYAKGKYLPSGEVTAPQKVERDVEHPDEVEIWTPEETRRILNAARPDEIAFFAISMFAGVRTKELVEMDWSHVRPSNDPDESHIEIKKKVSKKELGRRIIPIQPALAAYLEKIRKPVSGRVAPNKNMQTRQENIAKRAGLVWRHNACRHSYGSYRMAEIRNVHDVAEEMGNSPAIVKKHYFQAVTKAEAARFWTIRPE